MGYTPIEQNAYSMWRAVRGGLSGIRTYIPPPRYIDTYIGGTYIGGEGHFYDAERARIEAERLL